MAAESSRLKRKVFSEASVMNTMLLHGIWSGFHVPVNWEETEEMH